MQKGGDPIVWLKVKSVFEAALELPPGEREAFVEANTVGEPEVAGRLRQMLKAHSTASSLLDRSLPERIQSLAPCDAGRPDGLLPGQVLGGRYQLVRELGRGGNGFVWLANDEAVLGRAVAVKVLRPRAFGEAFNTELLALAKLDHSSIATPIDSGRMDGGHAFLVIEYVNGPSLRELLNSGPLEPMRACRLIRQTANALDAAHRQGVWHLDLKPENIVIRRAGEHDEQAVLVDFGISRLAISGTADPAPAGSLAYAAREQLEGAPSAASDQYSLARMAVEMITGHRPGPLESAESLLRHCGALRQSVIRTLARALSLNPEDRFPQVAQFAMELQAALDPEAASSRKRRLLAAAFCFLLFTVMAAYAWFNRREQRAMVLREAQTTASQIALASTLLEAGRLDQNLLRDTIKSSVHRAKDLVASGRRDPELLDALFQAQMRYAVMHGHPGLPHLGSLETGVQAHREALQVLELLYRNRDKDHDYARNLFWARDSLASILIEGGQIEQSEALSRESLHLLEKYKTDRWPPNTANSIRASVLMTLSRAPFHRREWMECLTLRDEGVHLKRIIASTESDPSYQRDLAGALGTRGFLLREMGRLADSLNDYKESDSILRRLIEGGHRNLRTDWLLAKNQLEEGRLELLRNRASEAERLLASAVQIHRRLAAELPLAVSIQRTLALSLCFLGVAHHRLGLPLEAWREELREAGRTATDALARDPRNVKARAEAEIIRAQAAACGIQLPALAEPTSD